MSVVTAIYNAPIANKIIDVTHNTVQVNINYNGKSYIGIARLHPNDKDFFSRKVGYNIALSRARLSAMKAELKAARIELNRRYDFYQEIIGYGKFSPAEVDPTGRVYYGITRLFQRTTQLKKAIKKEENSLRMYLQGQQKAIKSIKQFRAKDNNN